MQEQIDSKVAETKGKQVPANAAHLQRFVERNTTLLQVTLHERLDLASALAAQVHLRLTR